jgi:hypothetical protein
MAATQSFSMGTNGMVDINVSATQFDLSQAVFFHAPETPYNTGPSATYANDKGDIFGVANDWNGSNEMWYCTCLPGVAFLNVIEQGVTQTAEELNAGGMDFACFTTTGFDVEKPVF